MLAAPVLVNMDDGAVDIALERLIAAGYDGFLCLGQIVHEVSAVCAEFNVPNLPAVEFQEMLFEVEA